jgi:hypothetical protein
MSVEQDNPSPFSGPYNTLSAARSSVQCIKWFIGCVRRAFHIHNHYTLDHCDDYLISFGDFMNPPLQQLRLSDRWDEGLVADIDGISAILGRRHRRMFPSYMMMSFNAQIEALSSQLLNRESNSEAAVSIERVEQYDQSDWIFYSWQDVSDDGTVGHKFYIRFVNDTSADGPWFSVIMTEPPLSQ